MIVKEYFYNIRCDCCGRLADEDMWHNEPIKDEIDLQQNYRCLGGMDYCENCWSWDEEDNIVTKDGRKFSGETQEEIISEQ